MKNLPIWPCKRNNVDPTINPHVFLVLRGGIYIICADSIPLASFWLGSGTPTWHRQAGRKVDYYAHMFIKTDWIENQQGLYMYGTIHVQ